MPAVREAPNYSSTRVQRASRINGIESARLLQQLQCIERAKQHQCRMTNQDIRIISLSLDYIQSSSGNSPEAWRPSEVEGQTSPEVKPEGPCFMYGERIISRKIRRMQRPMSAVERVISALPDDSSVTSDTSSSMTSRPKSSPEKQARRPASAASWVRWRENQDDDDTDAYVTSETRHHQDLDRFSTHSSSSARVTPHQAWEDDTSLATKKILKAQALTQSGKRNSLYVSAGDVMTAQASRNVRNLARKIRMTTNPSMTPADLISSSTSPHNPVCSSPNRQTIVDKPPQRPSGPERDMRGRRATLGEILNQRKPTLSAGAWRNHINRTTVNPMSVSSQRQALLDVKKYLNESQRAEVEEKVKSFVQGGDQQVS